MNGLMQKKGFTLIEMLVASLLLGMLVTILTMIFNQSAIAWRTGKAGVSQLSLARRQIAYAARRADNVLPRVSIQDKSVSGEVLSPWNAEGQVRTRALAKISGNSVFGGNSFPDWSKATFDSASSSGAEQPWTIVNGIQNLKAGSSTAYIVGVLSCGPDGKKDTEDDNISTWPADVQ